MSYNLIPNAFFLCGFPYLDRLNILSCLFIVHHVCNFPFCYLFSCSTCMYTHHSRTRQAFLFFFFSFQSSFLPHRPWSISNCQSQVFIIRQYIFSNISLSLVYKSIIHIIIPLFYISQNLIQRA